MYLLDYKSTPQIQYNGMQQNDEKKNKRNTRKHTSTSPCKI